MSRKHHKENNESLSEKEQGLWNKLLEFIANGRGVFSKEEEHEIKVMERFSNLKSLIDRFFYLQMKSI
jgi:hypothetical protein